jgi:hypothetical protein
MGIIAEFMERLTAIEQVFGVHNFSFFGIVIEHPFIFWIFIPIFAFGFLMGLKFARISGVVTVISFTIITISVLLAIGFGAPDMVVSDMSVFLFSIPIMFSVACALGFLLRYVLRNACQDREGGILCKIV